MGHPPPLAGRRRRRGALVTTKISLSTHTVIDPNGVEEIIVLTVDGQSTLLNADNALEIAGQLMFLAAVLNPQLVDKVMR